MDKTIGGIDTNLMSGFTAAKSSLSSALIKNTQDTYLNANSLNDVKALGRENKAEALKEVSKKFESMFLQQMLKSMRDANSVFEEGDMFSSDEMKFHQDMMDQQMVLNLTSGNGIGIAKHLYQQMLHNAGIKSEVNTSSSNIQQKTTDVQAVAPSTKVFKTVSGKTLGVRASVAKSENEFVEAIRPYAELAARELNVGVDVILAQAALETGWGKHLIHDANGKNTFNLFNIKSTEKSSADSVSVNSLEYFNGVARSVQSKFKSYGNYLESMLDYVDLLKNSPRYQKQLSAADSSSDYADALQKAGYATDPKYAEKIKHLLQHKSIQTQTKNGDASEPG